MTTTVTFLRDWSSTDGASYLKGQQATLEDALAAQLTTDGYVEATEPVEELTFNQGNGATN